MSEARSTRDGPWAWFSKEAWALIHHSIEEHPQRCALTYIGLCKLASDRGSETYRASTRSIAEASMQGVKTVERALPALETVGLIRRKRNHLPNGGKDVTTYTLTAMLTHGPVNLTHGVIANLSDFGDASNCIKEKKEKEELEKAPSGDGSHQSLRSEAGTRKSAVSESVEAIYQAYPKKVAKPKALKAIEEALRDHAADYLLDRVQAYADATAKWPDEEQKFIPYPARWFNGKRFEDDPNEWASRTPKEEPFNVYASRPL